MKKSNSTLIKIVNILNDLVYHDGNSIGKTLNITRSAIWKSIKKLQAHNIHVDAQQGKGYKLLEPLYLLDKKYLKTHIDKNIHVEVFESIDSTNTFLRNNINTSHMILCLSEQQSAGRGRLNRDWYSPFAKNIYLSCSYSIKKDFAELAGLSLVVSLAVIKTLQKYVSTKKLFVKWPNDIIYDNKKLSGNLIEIQAQSNAVCHVIIGIGINVNMSDDNDQHIKQPWTSLKKITGKYYNRNNVIVDVVKQLSTYMTLFEEKGFPFFIKEWSSLDILKNKVITLNCLDKEIKGIASGINGHGNLLLQLDNGDIQAFSSGDASIIKNKSQI